MVAAPGGTGSTPWLPHPSRRSWSGSESVGWRELLATPSQPKEQDEGREPTGLPNLSLSHTKKRTPRDEPSLSLRPSWPLSVSCYSSNLDCESTGRGVRAIRAEPPGSVSCPT